MATPLARSNRAADQSLGYADPAIRVEGLRKSYAGRTVVNGLSFQVAHGEIFSLLGPNGAGKTTTIEIMEGYRARDGGTVRILGLDPERQADALHRRIGLMLQQGGFYPLATPAEVIHLFASFYDKPADPAALLRLVGLAEVAGTRYRRLSGGQKQRLSLAVALIGQPELVFLDEPTAGMDPQARHATWEIIRGLKSRGVTVILTTHLIDEAERLSDRVAIVDAGRLIALGTPAELTSGNATSDVRDVRLVTATPIPLEALAALAAARDVSEIEAGVYTLRTDQVSDLLVELTLWLQARRIIPRELRIGGGSLEEVFLRLTGKDLRA